MQQRMAEMETKFETERKEAENAYLKLQTEQQQNIIGIAPTSPGQLEPSYSWLERLLGFFIEIAGKSIYSIKHWNSK